LRHPAFTLLFNELPDLTPAELSKSHYYGLLFLTWFELSAFPQVYCPTVTPVRRASSFWVMPDAREGFESGAERISTPSLFRGRLQRHLSLFQLFLLLGRDPLKC